MKIYTSLLFFCLIAQQIQAQHLLPVYYAAAKRYGYHDQANKQVVAPKYLEAFPMFYQVGAIVKTEKGYGAINSKGEEIIPPQYEHQQGVAPNGNIGFRHGDTTLIYNREGKLVLKGKYRAVRAYDIDGHFVVSNEQGQQGLAQGTTQATIYPYYDMKSTDQNYFIGRNRSGYYGIIFPDGKEENFIYKEVRVLQSVDDVDDVFIRGKILFDKKILFNLKDKTSITLAYDLVEPLCHTCKDWLLVDQEDKKGVIDLEGKVVVPIEYEYISWCAQANVFLAINANVAQFYDTKGKPLGPKHQGAQCFNNGLALVMNQESRYGYLNTKGQMIVPYAYDYGLTAIHSASKIMAVKQGTASKPWLLLELLPSGQTKILNRFEHLERMSNHTAYVNTDSKTDQKQLVFQSGKTTNFAFDRVADPFPNTPWLTFWGNKDGEKCAGAYNTQGKAILPCEYDPFQFWTTEGLEHLIFVQHAKTKKKGVYDVQKDQWLVKPEADEVKLYKGKDPYIWVQQEKDGPVTQIIMPKEYLIFSAQP